MLRSGLDTTLRRPSQLAALPGRAVRGRDSVSAVTVGIGSAEASLAPVAATEALLILGDSLGAYQRVSRALDSMFPMVPPRRRVREG